jgi:hypothetical protein
MYLKTNCTIYPANFRNLNLKSLNFIVCSIKENIRKYILQFQFNFVYIFTTNNPFCVYILTSVLQEELLFKKKFKG